MLAYAGSVPLSYHVPPVAVADPRPIASAKDGSRAGAAALRGGLTGAPATGASDPMGGRGVKAAPALADPYALTGPTPAFDANVLDAESDFRAVLARFNLERARAEMAAIENRPGLAAAETLAGARSAAMADRISPGVTDSEF